MQGIISFIIAAVSLILLPNQGLSQTDQYVPMPQGWSVSWYYITEANLGGGGQYYHNHSEWGGDTLINGYTYTKMYDGIGTGHTYTGGIRQDIPNEKIYTINTSNVETDISFNQHAIVGDTIFDNTTLNPIYEVINLDSTLVNGMYRKRFHLQAFPPGSMQAIYIAGLGYVVKAQFEYNNYLECHSVNHQWHYGYDFVDDIINPACHWSLEESGLIKPVILSPNPAINQVNFNRSPDDVQIISNDGRVISVDQYQLIGTTLNISQLKSGIYHLNIAIDNSIVQKKLIKL